MPRTRAAPVTINCAVCGKLRTMPHCWFKRTKAPTCSRQCNGVLRGQEWAQHGHKGSAARFFYCAKADADDRLASKHPTVKPVSLMQWLIRLVTPPKGLCLDPFAGTGTTAEACFREGFRSILIEREEKYIADIHRRIELMAAGPFERAGKIAKQEAAESLPLFAA